MEYRNLGDCALKVSPLCLGTMNFGPRCSEKDSHAILDAAFEQGINFIDTANHYGGTGTEGRSETIIGNWLKANPEKRKRLVIATKVYATMSQEVNDMGLSAYHIRTACEDSLKRLGVECIDIYQMHHIDRTARYEEIWQAMDVLIGQGKVTYVGTSNFPGWALAQTGERRRQDRRMGPVSEQSLYNLFERRAELEVIPACREYGIGLIPWSPLAGGLLAGKARSDAEGGRRNTGAIVKQRENNVDQIDRFEALCRDIDQTPSAVALAWLANREQVASVILGPATVEQLLDAAKAQSLTLDAETSERLDQIFPPQGEAPEAYAW